MLKFKGYAKPFKIYNILTINKGDFHNVDQRSDLHNASWIDDQSLIRRQRRLRVKPSSNSDLIWTALVQHKLWLNRDKVQIWTWFKLDDVGETRP